MMSSMMPVGVVAGAIIVVNGFNTLSREVGRTFLNDKQTEGMFADGPMAFAEFLGFAGHLPGRHTGQSGVRRVWPAVKARSPAALVLDQTGLFQKSEHNPSAYDGTQNCRVGRSGESCPGFALCQT